MTATATNSSDTNLVSLLEWKNREVENNETNEVEN